MSVRTRKTENEHEVAWTVRAKLRVPIPWMEGALLALLVLVIFALGGDAVRASYHGYLHVSLGEAVMRDGLVPENPYHAGVPLRYYTLYPYLGVLLGRTGIGPLWAFALLNVAAALLLPPALDALGAKLGLDARSRRATFLAALLGFNGLGWIGYLCVSGEPFGRPPVYALMPLTLARESFGWDARLQAFLPKFLNVSSFALALPFALWALAHSLPAGDARARPWHASVHTALSLALNPLAGAFAGACIAMWIVPSLVRESWKQRLTWIAAGAAALVLASPFLRSAMQTAPSGPSLTGNPDLGGSPLANVIGPLLALLVPGVLGLMQMSRGARWRWSCASVLAAALVLAGEMPQGNEYKMERLAGLMWAIPAGAWAARAFALGGAGRIAALALATLCVPTTVIATWAYVAYGAHAPKLPLTVSHGRLALDPTAVDHPLPREIFSAEAAADRDAILVMGLAQPGTRLEAGLVQGNALAPALNHPLFVDLPQIHNERRGDLPTRLDLVGCLWSGRKSESTSGLEPMTSAQALAALRASAADRSWLFITHESALELNIALAAAGAHVLAQGDGFTLYSLAAVLPRPNGAR